MAGFFEKIKNTFLGEDYDDEDYDDMVDYEEQPEEPSRYNNVTSFNKYSSSNRRTQNHNIMNISTSVQMGVYMFNPKTLEDASEACIEIKDKNIVVVNLENVEYEISQRISDFLCGAGYALECNIQLISDKIMIITPINVELSGELKNKLQENGIKIPNSIWR